MPLFMFPKPTKGLEFEHFAGLADALVQLHLYVMRTVT